MGMHKGGGTKKRGRTAGATNLLRPKPTHPNVPLDLRAETTRPVSSGGTIHRGDRRDMNRQYTGNIRHQPNFSDPLGSGKKQIQSGGKARSGGGKREKGTY